MHAHTHRWIHTKIKERIERRTKEKGIDEMISTNEKKKKKKKSWFEFHVPLQYCLLSLLLSLLFEFLEMKFNWCIHSIENKNLRYLSMIDWNTIVMNNVSWIDDFEFHWSLSLSLILLYKKKNSKHVILSLSLSNSSYQERIQSFPFDHEHSLQYMYIVRNHLYCSSIVKEEKTHKCSSFFSLCLHTWIVKRLVDIVWLTRVLLWRCSPINWPFFSQLIRANGRLNAWHSIVTFRYWTLWIKSFFTDTIGGSKSNNLFLPFSYTHTLSLSSYIQHWL